MSEVPLEGILALAVLGRLCLTSVLERFCNIRSIFICPSEIILAIRFLASVTVFLKVCKKGLDIALK